MKWLDAKKFINGSVKNWQILKEQFNGKEREILESAYLVVSYSAGQIELSALTPEAIALNHPKLLAQTCFNVNFVNLMKKKAWLMNHSQKNQKALGWIETKIRNINMDMIEIVPVTVELRFRQLNFYLIQRLKDSEYCDKANTDMSKVSIRVVLK
jgi:hypothetical protein